MKSLTLALMSSALLAGLAVPAGAQGLLGIIGGSDDSTLITLGSGDAGDKGLVNLGVGGGDNLLDVNVGNGDVGKVNVGTGRGGSLVDADVKLLDDNVKVDATVGGNRGLVDANVDVLNETVRVDANVGGDNGLVDVGVGVGGGNNGGGNNGGGNSGGGNNGGGNNGGGNNGGGNNGGGNNGLPPTASTGSSGSAATCAGVSVSELDRLLRSTRIDGSWQRASNVAVQRVQICPSEQTWLAAALASTGLGSNLQSAVANDPLLATSLSRASLRPDRVFAVQRTGNQLTVFVY